MKNVFNLEYELFRNVEREKNKKLSSVVLILLIPILCFIIGGSVSGVAMQLLKINDRSIGLIISTGTAIILLFMLVKFKERRNVSSLGLRLGKEAFENYMRGFGLGLLMFTGAILVVVILAGGEIKFEGIRFSQILPFGVMLLGWIVQGASEEILIRGYMLPALALKKGVKLAVTVSSLYFAALHLGNQGISFIGFTNIVLVGIFTTFYALGEGSIWGVCGWHSAWNFAQGNIFGSLVSGMQLGGGSLFAAQLLPGKDLLTGGSFGIEASSIVTVIFAIAIAISYMKLVRRIRENL